VEIITINQNKDALITAISDSPKVAEPIQIHFDHATGMLKISYRKSISFIRVYSMSGIQVKAKTCPENGMELPVYDLSPGIYIVSAEGNNRVVYSKKFVKN